MVSKDSTSRVIVLSLEDFDEDLHASPKPEDQVEGGFLLDGVISEDATILQLVAGKGQTLLVWEDALLILDLGLHIVNGVERLHLKDDRLPRQGIHKDLHATVKMEDKVDSGLLLDVIVSKGTAILKLLTIEDQTLQVWQNTLLVSDLSLDVVDGVRRLYLEVIVFPVMQGA